MHRHIDTKSHQKVFVYYNSVQSYTRTLFIIASCLQLTTQIGTKELYSAIAFITWHNNKALIQHNLSCLLFSKLATRFLVLPTTQSGHSTLEAMFQLSHNIKVEMGNTRDSGQYRPDIGQTCRDYVQTREVMCIVYTTVQANTYLYNGLQLREKLCTQYGPTHIQRIVSSLERTCVHNIGQHIHR